jgi:ABC-type uncharacterized transport system ATPase subunit/ABC-type branched-subunit amino acid transport system permease subunit
MRWALVVLGGAALFTGFVVTRDPYFAYVATSWVIAGILALSLDLVWGRGGILSLGQTALYGVGGYCAGVLAINLADAVGSTLVVALPAGAAAGALGAAVLGRLMVYARMGPLQQTILTYTCTVILWTSTASFQATFGDAVVGGQNGLSGIPGFSLGSAEVEPRTMFVITMVVALLMLAVARGLVRSSFGTVIDAIRLDHGKAELLGYDVRGYQLRLFVAAGAIAGLAGAMFTLWANFISPSAFSVQDALLVPIYVLVGGIGTLAGPFVGAIAVGGLTFWLGGGAGGGQTTIWLGAVLILLVRFNRAGLFGLARALGRRLGRRAPAASGGGAPVKADQELVGGLLERVGERPAGTLATRDVAVEFGGVRPVDGVTREFAPGRIHCLIGPNGAGKSSYLKACTGVYRLSGGEVLLSGTGLRRTPPHQRVRRGLGIKNQKAQVFGELDVRRNFWVAAYGRCHDRARAAEIAEDALRMLGLAERADRPAGDLSHGDQQWVDIGMVLCQAPSVLLLDEPAAGMTTGERGELARVLRALAPKMTIVLVEHDMAFVRELDPSVTVLHHGAVFAEGGIDEIHRDPAVLDIYLGRRRHALD